MDLIIKIGEAYLMRRSILCPIYPQAEGDCGEKYARE